MKNTSDTANISDNRASDDAIQRIGMLEQQLSLLATNSPEHRRLAKEISTAADLYRRSLDAAQASKQFDQ